MSDPREPRLPYLAPLDGIRALAVLAVIGVHQEFTWLPGGFYGVDAFFALSGFLITSLLVTEWRGSGTVRLGRFWARRARRLLPALFVLVAAVGLVAAVWPDVLGAPHLLGNAVATVFYSANWYLVAQHTTYFGIVGQPSPLLHTWSLAIEEQFYLVWPLVVLAVLRPWRQRPVAAAADGVESASPVPGQVLTLRRAEPAAGRDPRARRLEVLLGLSVAGAVASALAMALLSPMGSVSNRAYYGTDTRAQGLLVGAALAIALARFGLPTRPRWRAGVVAAGLAGAFGTLALWLAVPETSPFAFHGGFLVAALATTAVIAAVATAPASALARALSVRPLRALGRISYAVYLWYWPVNLVVAPPRVELGPYPLFLLRLAVTVGIASASWVLVERPVRARTWPRWQAAVAAPAAAALAVGLVAAGGLAPLASASPAVHVVAARGDFHPTKVLLVGDSEAGSLGVGLGEVAPRFGVQLMNDGDPQCSVSMDGPVKILWYTIDPRDPCQDGDPDALLARWRYLVDHYNPDVVVYLARGETFTQQVDGRWESLGQPDFDRYLAGRFHQAVDVLGSRGAAVVLLTSPFYDSEFATHSPWPEDEPQRVDIDNAIMRQVVTGYHHSVPTTTTSTSATGGPSAVTVVNLGAMVSVRDHFVGSIDGAPLRCGDGVHFTAQGGAYVAPRLLPTLVALGRDHHVRSPEGSWPGPPPPAVPSWWPELPCGS